MDMPRLLRKSSQDAHRLFRLWYDQSGQIAIFVALIFQVLFVFFAMSINVALVVHDKINLQNSVDLAAYYMAQRQAEVLNVMAHQNYAIRQSWKLLSFRIRVLGSMGLESPAHPARSRAGSGPLADTEFAASNNAVVCVTYRPVWRSDEDNLCKQTNVVTPSLPDLSNLGATFFGVNVVLRQVGAQLAASFTANCNTHGAHNWTYLARSLAAFRLDQLNRKQVIIGLANGLGTNNFHELDGSRVGLGAGKTFTKNLTYGNCGSNSTASQPSDCENIVSFEILNSLRDVGAQAWVRPIDVFPQASYLDPTADTTQCSASSRPIRAPMAQSMPQRPAAMNIIQNYPDFNNLYELVTNSGFGDPFEQLQNYSVGVEKNPWMMAYVGVKATTESRQVFAPFGGAVQLTARGFAKPFGGRMGPWYAQNWTRGDSQSSGNPIDPLLPPRNSNAATTDPRNLPNYGRFPGDTLGLRSSKALSAIVGVFPTTAGGPPLISLNHYRHLTFPMEPGYSGDILAYDYANSNPAVAARAFEQAAIAPDVFDASYYSIEPNFNEVYLPRLRQNQAALGIDPGVLVRGDLGSLAGSPQNQRNLVTGVANGSVYPDIYYVLRDVDHLLVDWAPSGPTDFSFPDGFFGECGARVNSTERPDLPPVPGGCLVQGGRSGYSVKMVAKDWLLSNGHNLGGPGGASGPILNPPSNFDGW